MALELSGEIYVEKIYFLAYDQTDWMAYVFKKTPSSVWEAEYRFRYYRDDRDFDSQDEKSWYRVTGRDGSNQARDQIVWALDSIADVIALVQGSLKIDDRIVVRGDKERALELLSGCRWMHVKTEERSAP